MGRGNKFPKNNIGNTSPAMQVKINSEQRPGWRPQVKAMWAKSRSCVVIAVFLVVVTIGLGFCSQQRPAQGSSLGGVNASDVGEALSLTPFVRSGDLTRAKALSEVLFFKKLGNVTSFSGYFTTNESLGSNLFFWFFPAQQSPKDAPLILWLQGGPGQPSTIGLFAENGPLEVTNDGRNLNFREITWTKAFNMLYIDSPVGTGCSYSNPEGFAKTHMEVTENLYEALGQFFTVFSEYRSNDFYIAGESYAGKYAPNLGKWIHDKNRSGKTVRINLKGLVIGNGFVDPERMIFIGDYLYNLGILDERDRDDFRSVEDKAVKMIQEDKIKEANDLITDLIHMGGSKYERLTGLHQYYNILRTQETPYAEHLRYLRLPEIRRAIHIGNVNCVYEFIVAKHLENDLFLTAKPAFEYLLDRGYKILLYNGNLDIIVPIPNTLEFIRSLRWRHADRYRNASRVIWKMRNNTVAGYEKSVENFAFVTVRNAGHMAVMDQPEYCFDMVQRFIFGRMG